MIVERIDVEFYATDRTRLAAWLFRPPNNASLLPAVTMSHGFSATRYHGIERMAKAIAAAGFVVLLHDHRNFGDSGGVPRQDIDPWVQIDDWRQAISFLESLPGVDPDRIGVWGTSYSGGHAIVLGATDRRLKAIVSQVPTIDGYASSLRRIPPQAIHAVEQLFIDDSRTQQWGEPPLKQRLVDLDPTVPALYRTQDTADFLLQPLPRGIWSNEITVQSVRRARMYEPGRWIDRISPTPLLMIVARNDTTAPTDLALSAYERALEPKSLVIIRGGHYAPYLEAFQDAADAAVQWFSRHL
jgi:uncharacterized protein